MLKNFLLTTIVLFLLNFTNFAQTPSFNTLAVWGDSCSITSNGNHVSLTASTINSNSGTTLEIYWGDGTSDVVLNQGQGYFYKNHNYASIGTYTVAGILFDGTTAVDTMYETVSAFCTVVQGVAYKRSDANCTKDSAEAIINTPFAIEVRKAGIPVDTIYSHGNIYKKIESADMTSVFSLHLLDAPYGTILACPTSFYTFKFDTLDYNTFEGFNFAFDCDAGVSNFDLSVSTGGFFRTVANSYIYLYPRNTGCVATNSIVTLDISPKYSFVSSNVTPTSTSGNTITWDVANLSNTSFNNIYVVLNAVGILTPGDTVQNHVNITPTTGDYNPANNTVLMLDSIRASCDPNEKHAQPFGDITDGELMTYTIHFENLGNDTAFNIHIMDTLSAHVNQSSFKLITSSHPVSYQLINEAGIETIRFDFANIMLADSSAPNENKGFVTYQINAKTGLALGTVIENTAHIYFDINPAIVTNTTRNKIPENVGIRLTQNAHSIKLYPNPASDKLFVEGLENFKDLNIVNTLGQTFKVEHSTTQYISIEQLPAGVYFLKATGKDGLYTQKFTKH